MIICTRSITELQIRFGWWNWWGLLVEVHVQYMVDTSSWWVGTYMRCIVDDVGTYWWVIVDEYLTHYWYILGTWLVSIFYGIGWLHIVWYRLVHGWCTCLWYRLITGWGIGWCMVYVYIGISHSDSVTMVPLFYFYFRAVGRGKDRWL